MKKKTHLIIAIAVIALISISYFFYDSMRKSIIQSGGVHYFLMPGTTPRKFAHDLQQQTELKNPALILMLLKQHPGKKLQVGEYLFPAGSTAEEVVSQVLNGKVMYHSFTIIDGWNIYQVMNALQQSPLIQHTLTNTTPAQIAKQMNMPYSTPEGWLMPETYYYTWNTSDISLLNRAYTAMQDFMNVVWLERAPNLPYASPYQALIVASMIEKETAQSNEMPIIANVILKRLAINMVLQIDSTVIYGMLPHFSGKLTHQDLHVKSPYNTYTNTGLPITPISMPGKLAIMAALHPASSTAWYFVAKGDGTHVFSETLQQQEQAILQYQKNKPATSSSSATSGNPV